MNQTCILSPQMREIGISAQGLVLDFPRDFFAVCSWPSLSNSLDRYNREALYKNPEGVGR